MDGETPETLRRQAERDRAEALAGQICASATITAQADCHLLELIGEIDGRAQAAVTAADDHQVVVILNDVLDDLGQTGGVLDRVAGRERHAEFEELVAREGVAGRARTDQALRHAQGT